MVQNNMLIMLIHRYSTNYGRRCTSCIIESSSNIMSILSEIGKRYVEE